MRLGRKVPFMALLLGILCAVGLIVSSQRYYLLQAADDLLKTHNALDESFSMAIAARVARPGSSSKELASAVTEHLQQTGEVRRATSQLHSKIRASELLSIGLWVAALAIILFALNKKRDPDAEPPS
jgi:C4-dicarboxylate-specific signal transduction histidine kinase